MVHMWYRNVSGLPGGVCLVFSPFFGGGGGGGGGASGTFGEIKSGTFLSHIFGRSTHFFESEWGGGEHKHTKQLVLKFVRDINVL